MELLKSLGLFVGLAIVIAPIAVMAGTPVVNRVLECDSAATGMVGETRKAFLEECMTKPIQGPIKPSANTNNLMTASELAPHCRQFDQVCQTYVMAVHDTQDLWHAFGLPGFRMAMGPNDNVKALIERLNAYNEKYPDNTVPTRSAAAMVLDGLGEQSLR